MVPSALVFLPRDILYLIATYFLKPEDQNKIIFHFTYDWRNFVNSSKEIFGKWKKESQIIVLTYPQVEDFQNVTEFRERILSMIENPRRQLDLIFTDRDGCERYIPDKPQINLNSLNSVRKIVVKFSKRPPAITFPTTTMDVEEIILRGKPKDLSFLSSVKSVCFEPRNDKKYDLAPLQNIENGIFELETGACVNYHLLGNLKSLEISSPSIKDASCFQNIPVLELGVCPQLSDVSSLGRVRNLKLRVCKRISDVSALTNVHSLDLCACPRVKDLSALGGVHSLKIQDFQGNDVSGLKNVVILNLYGAREVSNISMLESVRVLDIQQCNKIQTLAGLANLKELMIDRQNKITTGKEIFQQLTKLDMNCYPEDEEGEKGLKKKFWEDLQCLESLTNLQDLTISYSQSLKRIPFIAGMRSLTLYECDGVRTLSVPALPSLGFLSIWNCNNLKSLHLVGSPLLKYPVYFLEVMGCHELKKFRIDRKVFTCKINWCSMLHVIELHQQIAHLRFDSDSWSLERIINQSWIVCPDLYLKEHPRPVLSQGKDELTFEYGESGRKKMLFESSEDENGRECDEEDEDEDEDGAESGEDEEDEDGGWNEGEEDEGDGSEGEGSDDDGSGSEAEEDNF
jgi:Leucine-rich repeat (LRR) protein